MAPGIGVVRTGSSMNQHVPHELTHTDAPSNALPLQCPPTPIALPTDPTPRPSPLAMQVSGRNHPGGVHRDGTPPPFAISPLLSGRFPPKGGGGGWHPLAPPKPLVQVLGGAGPHHKSVP